MVLRLKTWESRSPPGQPTGDDINPVHRPSGNSPRHTPKTPPTFMVGGVFVFRRVATNWRSCDKMAPCDKFDCSSCHGVALIISFHSWISLVLTFPARPLTSKIFTAVDSGRSGRTTNNRGNPITGEA